MFETCLRCPEVRHPDTALAWAHEPTPDGRDGWLCPACVRRHVRAIEAGLAPEWW